MSTKKGPPPAALGEGIVSRLLDLLSTDDDFRDLFQRDAHAALMQAGYQAPAGTAPEAAAAMSGGACMQLSATDQLAPKEAIARDRVKLEQTLNVVQRFEPAIGFKAG